MDERYTKFETSLRGLIKVSIKVMGNNDNSRDSRDSNLTKYSKLLDRTDISDHFNIFNELYTKYRYQILRAHLNDHWLRQRKRSIVVSIKDVRLNLSEIYEEACQMASEAEERVSNLPEKARDSTTEIIYPCVFLLHLSRMFRECIILDKKPNIDLDRIHGNIDQLESYIKTPTLRTVPTTNSSSSPAPPQLPAGINNIMGALTKALGDLEKGQPGSNPMDSIGRVINGIVGNPEVRQGLNTIFSGIPNTQNPTEIVTHLAQKTGNSELVETVKQTFGSLPAPSSSSTEMGKDALIEYNP
jgi:hypothetical protein